MENNLLTTNNTQLDAMVNERVLAHMSRKNSVAKIHHVDAKGMGFEIKFHSMGIEWKLRNSPLGDRDKVYDNFQNGDLVEQVLSQVLIEELEETKIFEPELVVDFLEAMGNAAAQWMSQMMAPELEKLGVNIETDLTIQSVYGEEEVERHKRELVLLLQNQMEQQQIEINN